MGHRQHQAWRRDPWQQNVRTAGLPVARIRGTIGTRQGQNKEEPMAFKKAKATDKPLTKSKIIEALAEETGVAKKDVANVLNNLAELAYSQASVGFTVPGLGKLVIAQRKARKGRNPATGETIKIPAKKVVKFRLAKAAKDATMTK